MISSPAMPPPIPPTKPSPRPPSSSTSPPSPSEPAIGGAASDHRLTIDQLAAASHVPSRTIRFYQSRGALMAPEIRGRVAYYGEQHAERLKLIAQLQDRGLRIDAIGDLMKRIDRGEVDLAEWLGVEEQMQTPWAPDQARTVSEAELYELAGTRRPGLVAELARAKIIERKGDVFLLGSPALLALAMKLEAAGIELATAASASAILRKHLSRAVAELVELFTDRIRDGHISIAQSGKLFETFRGVGVESVRVLFARQMEHALRKLVSSGKLAGISTRSTRKR